ncbi:MAG: PTS transporter subunit EIIB [Actinobacteria bacterium]|nr:PTS transporter subunit EIIB [Actinomycetota bacterium]MCG2799051.1 PTS transporter subunit EIIB [Cellulomonas sp.]
MNRADELATRLLGLVGGPDNVVELTHCWARLRFVLRDEAMADDHAIGALDQVAVVVRQHGQLQVALMRGLLETYDALRSQLP